MISCALTSSKMAMAGTAERILKWGGGWKRAPEARVGRGSGVSSPRKF